MRWHYGGLKLASFQSTSHVVGFGAFLYIINTEEWDLGTSYRGYVIWGLYMIVSFPGSFPPECEHWSAYSRSGESGNEAIIFVMASQEKREFDKYLKFLTFKVL